MEIALAASYRHIVLVSRIFHGFTATARPTIFIARTHAHMGMPVLSLDALHRQLTMSEPHACKLGFIMVIS